MFICHVAGHPLKQSSVHVNMNPNRPKFTDRQPSIIERGYHSVRRRLDRIPSVRERFNIGERTWKAIKFIGIIVLIIALATIGAVVYISTIKYTAQVIVPVPPTDTPVIYNTLICPEPLTVYLTQHRQEILMEGVTTIDGRPIPSLIYKALIEDNSVEYEAPSTLILTQHSVGRIFLVKVTLKDFNTDTSHCSYNISVEGMFGLHIHYI